MKKLWSYIENRRWNAATKFEVTALLNALLAALAGFAVWMMIRPWGLSSEDWMFCFIGYPAVLSCVNFFLYSCRHEFHNGSVR